MASPSPLVQESGEMAELELQSQPEHTETAEAFSDPEKQARGIQPNN